MPITENGFEYTIPDKYKKMITKSFLQTLKYELRKIFPDSVRYLQNEEAWTYLSGTGGWQMAFTATSILYGLDELLLYYNSLPWYDSDMFDGELEDIALSLNVIDPMAENTKFEILHERLISARYTWRVKFEYFLKYLKR